METAISYQFPVSHSYEIKEVLDLNFDILPYPEAWADLNALRSDDYLQELYQYIGFENGRLPPEPAPQFKKKIIFTGHVGCGKSLELYRLKEYLDQPGRFLCIYVNTESELRPGEFEWQDFFVLLVNKLAEKIKNRDLNQYAALTEIAHEWASTRAVREEFAKLYKEEFNDDGSLAQKVFREFTNPENLSWVTVITQ